MKREINSCLTCGIRQCSILKNCQDEFLEFIDRSKYCMKYISGQQLIREGSEKEGIYIISSGVVKLHVKGYRKRPFILHLVATGDTLGHETDGNNRYQVSATAVEETQVCFIENKDFDIVWQNNAGIRDDMLEEFNTELNKTRRRMVQLAQMNVREKIAAGILHIARAYQVNELNEPFKVNLSREDIGDLAGVTKEQVSKNLSEFTKEKIISVKGKQLQIFDYEKLEAITSL